MSTPPTAPAHGPSPGPGPLAGPGTQLDAQRPWPGLSPFAEGDSAYFFGRTQETQALQEMVERAGVLVLYGQSGLGKTSLLRAGLFPALKSSDHLPVWVRLDYAADAPELASQVLQAVAAAFQQAGVEAPPPRPDDTLWSYFHRADADFWGPRNRLIRPLVVLDQFEELFTLGQRDAAAAARAERFVRALEAQVEQRPPPEVRALLERQPERAVEFDVNRENLRLIVSLREDYLPHLDAWRERMPSMLARRFRLEPMSQAQALEVVRKGGAAVVDDGVAQEIVGFVASGDGLRQVEPAILSVVCEELNTRRLAAGLPRITRELLSGERSRIIADFYERAFRGLPEPVRDWVEDELLTASGHRDRAALEDARRAGLDPAHLETLVGRRVLHSDERHQVVWVEFTHDLLTQPALASRHAREQRRAEAKAAHREAQVRDKLRRSRRLSAAFGVMALAMAGLTWWALQQRNEAQQQRAEAEHQRQRAEAQTEAARSAGQRADSARQEADQRAAEAAANAASAQQSAALAAAQAQRALRAEGEAREHLDDARNTALLVARQAVQDLQRQWVAPTADSARLVEASLNSVAPLATQFADTAPLHQAHRQAQALGALVLADRGDLSGCAPLVDAGDPGRAKAASPDAPDTAALAALAAARCGMLAGHYSQATARLTQARNAAQALPASHPMRLRLLAETELSVAAAALARYRADEARSGMDRLDQLLAQAQHAPGVDREEWLQWQLALLGLRAAETDDPERALALQQQIQRERGTLGAGRTDTLYWRGVVLKQELDRAGTLWGLGRLAEADELLQTTIEGFDRWLAVDPGHAEHQLRRNDGARIQADILATWARQTAAVQRITEIEQRLAPLARAQPQRPAVREQQGVLSWLRAKFTPQSSGEDTTQLYAAAVQAFEALVRQTPERAVAVRSWAVALAGLGDRYVALASAASADAQTRASLRERAAQQYRQGLQVLERLPQARGRHNVATLGGYMALQLGDLALAQGHQAQALAHYQHASRLYMAVPVAARRTGTRLADALTPELYIARTLRQSGRADEADQIDRSALQALEQARQAEPTSFALANQIAWVHRMAASDQFDQNRPTDALHSLTKAATVIADVLRQDPLSRPAEAELAAVRQYVFNTLAPAVEKNGSPALRRALAALKNATRPPVTPPDQTQLHPTLPLMAGDWQHLDPARLPARWPALKGELATLAQAGWTAQRARRLPLPCYDDADLLELDLAHADGRLGVAGFLADGKGTALRLNGDATVLHTYNRQHPLHLRTETQVRHYLRFFLAAIDSPQGQFRLIEQPSQLMWLPEATPAHRTAAERRIEPLRLARADSGAWTALATVQHGGTLYQSKLTLERNGLPDMPRDSAAAADLPLATTRYEQRLLRVSDSFPGLEQALTAAKDARQWARAVQLQQDIIASKRQRLGPELLKRELPSEYVGLSWYRLLSSDPAGALQAANDGLALAADDLPLKTNRAHALLLLGRQDEALTLYRAHLGQRVGGAESRLWEQEILADLDQFDKYGLKHPGWAAVRALMTSASPAAAR